MIDRYLLRYFLAVIDCGTFSKAARQVNVAQPTLSVGIGKLERLLGARLFERSSRHMQLTVAGMRFAKRARHIESEFNIAESEVVSLKQITALRLGVVSTFPMHLVGECIRSASQTGSIERVQFVGGSERELYHRLRLGQIDSALTIVRHEAGRFASEGLFTEGYAMVVSVGHPLAGKKSATAEELAETPAIIRRHCEVVSETSKHFIERGVRPFVAFRSTNDEQVLALIQAGMGSALMPASYIAKKVVPLPLVGFELTREIGLLYAEHAEHLQVSGSEALKAIRARFLAGPKRRPRSKSE